MDDMLKPVKTTIVQQRREPDEETHSSEVSASIATVCSPQDVLQLLKGSPGLPQVESVLTYLQAAQNDNFNVKIPSAIGAQVIQTLVTQTIPDFWPEMQRDKGLAKSKLKLLGCLRSVSGLGALLARTKILTGACKVKGKPGESSISPTQLQILLEFIEEIVQPDTLFETLWFQSSLDKSSLSRRAILWKEFTVLVASGKLMSVFAEAEDVLHETWQHQGSRWVANGGGYTRWIARNISLMIKDASKNDKERWVAAAGVCGKALSLGYSDILIGELIYQLPLKQDSLMEELTKLVHNLHTYEQRSILNSVMQVIAQMCVRPTRPALDPSTLKRTPPDIAGSAALLHGFIEGNDILTDGLVELLTKPDTSPLTGSVVLQRVALAALSTDEDRMSTIMEKCMERFGDQLFIKHAPIVQQEAISQTLLISSGYVHRKQPMFLFTIAKSSVQMHGISNRLKSTSPRARWLGMIVGMIISRLTDKSEARLIFDDDSMETLEAKWYQTLVHVDDKVGKIDNIRQSKLEREGKIVSDISTTSKKQTFRSNKSTAKQYAQNITQPPMPSGVRIVELEEDGEDDDLVPYAKPDSDPEDEDEDPTLVQRDKPKPPVYIRDLISGLRDSENYDRHLLALQTASTLIRRKANFGKEVSDHAEELANILIGLNDHFEIEDFSELRQEALIALLVAQPAHIAQYLARSCFEGDYSLQQRTAMLTVLGFGARELAGFKDGDRPEVPSFPTKQLPEHLHKLYSEEKSISIAKVSALLEKSMIEPMALKAADQISGPNALKVRTFSSRMAVEKARKKPIPNELAKIVAQHFFFPLTGRWWTQIQSYGNRSLAFSTHLLPTYLRTLALLLHASGPSTLSLPQMTSELWELLLSLRSSALSENDIGVLESLLFTFLTLLEVNEDKQRLATEHAKELVETQEWAKLVLERRGNGTGGGDKEGGNVSMLAAAVVVRCHEVVEKWQRLMLGDMIDL